MKYALIIVLFFSSMCLAQELKIKAESFSTDEAKGITIFSGLVNIIKSNDELNASRVVVYTNAKKEPTKFIITGDASFKISTKDGAKYQGSAQKVIYKPQEKEYRFYGNVHLKQLDEKKEIRGDEVVLNVLNGKAYAKGLKKEPVIMIFDIKDEE